jgi:hypothetical protein
MTRAAAAGHLLVMGIAILAGYLVLGVFGTRLGRFGIRPRHLFAAGFGLNVAALALIVLRAPGGVVWWSCYGLGAAVNVLAFAVLNEGFPRDLVGRANTAVNLVMFAGSFATQWGIGVIVDLARGWGGLDTASGLRYAMTLVLVLNLAVLAWFAAGWKRFAVHTPAPAAA